MIRPRSWTVGNSEDFAISISFDSDPDGGHVASVENAASWGSLQLWVNGLNLCQHQELNYSLDKVHWYMFPVLRWFVTNWDYLLHEERLPNRNLDRDAWLTLRHTANPPPAIKEDQADKWEERYQVWWSRHSLLACREGGLFPNVFIRRFRDSIEFSWGPTPIAGRPEHYRFFAAHGYARVEARLVVDQLEDILDSAIEHLCSELPQNEAFKSLRNDFQALRSDERLPGRLGLMAGHSGNGQSSGQRYGDLCKRFSARDLNGAWKAFIEGEYSRSFVSEAPPVCLMFGSLSPSITDADVARIAELVVGSHSEVEESPKLKQLVRDEPIVSALQRPWEQGYELAEAFHEALSDDYTDTAPVDIEEVVADFEICVSDIALDDNTIRAIAIAGEGFCPTIAMNRSYRYQERYPRRFTLAHELCHLLHDRSHGLRLALASGPWAPVDIEKRANAFAAMFLMPRELIDSLVEVHDLRVDSVAEVWKLCEYLQVSFSATIEHLCNLGYIDDLTRDGMKQEVIENYAPRPADD